MIEERRVALEMIGLYCRGKEGHRGPLCDSCRELAAYAMQRLSRCKFAPDKPTCRKCPVHCYRPDMRERMRAVMRYAGPRMMFVHPAMAFRHLLREWGLL